MTIGDGLVAIAAALAVMTGIFSTVGQGYAAAKAVESVGKNPEAENEIRTMLILGAGIAETAAIYGLLIAFLILFAY
ncbi:MAG TPA: ATP synthase F0 subunit C [Companilactobacillus farciminis]|uniref:ATP synthase subunit c n=2 Tax=Lactobacillales TaxID=186826 RepID=A0A921LAK0_9LACO|nr:ATP synthase F0 subunit C [Candidatus Atopostipes pullistercoris]HJF87883.1 ATP synthase F0 subunit C [Companilactobacillus farciminis]